jgi:hypothetical protein
MRRFLIIHKFLILKQYLVYKSSTQLYTNSDSSDAENTSAKTSDSLFTNSAFKKSINKACSNINTVKSFND